MRAAFLALVLTLPLFSGCLGGGPGSPPAGLDPARVQVPEGALLATTDDGVVLTWADVTLPFRADFVLPEGATVVRAVVDHPGDRNSLWLVHADTQRRRCNTETSLAWGTPVVAARSCSGLTVVDRPGDTWQVQALTPTGLTTDVRVILQGTPLDGHAALLDTSLLSRHDHEVGSSTTFTIESFDGTPLFAELTLPAGDGPWPTVVAPNPYNTPGPRDPPSMWSYWVHDFVRRGYAALVTDVRGFGDSGGCVNVWGPEEQLDQVATVEWVARQPWSDGRVAMYGQSYVGTTPVQAAVHAPEALKAIIAVAPVISAYDDWHYGGVPNGEGFLSPLVGYQGGNVVSGANVRPEEPEASVLRTYANLCDPTLTVRANDPRFVYTDFYTERDFKLRAGDVRAAVLYTQGFEDLNVKSMMIPGWFNEIQAPKLGLFGHWMHQHPPRADGELLMLAWLDQYLKEKPMGLERLPAVDVHVDRQHHRTADVWPDPDLPVATLYPHLAADTLASQPAPGTRPFLVLPLDPGGTPLATVLGENGVFLRTYTTVLDAPLTLSGSATLELRGTFNSGGNAFLAAGLYRDRGEGLELATFGMANLAHRGDHTTYTPYAPGEAFLVPLPFQPTELLLAPGETVVLEIRVTTVTDLTAVNLQPGHLTLHGGEDGTKLLLPGPDADAYPRMPHTVRA